MSKETESVVGPAGHEYALKFPKRSAAEELESPFEKRPKPATANTPSQTSTNLGDGVARISNHSALVEKGRPTTEYKSSSGWTTINESLANCFVELKPTGLYRDRLKPSTEYDYLNLDDEYDEQYDNEEDYGDKDESDGLADDDAILRVKATNSELVMPKDGGLGSIDGLDLSAVMKKDKAKFSVGQEKKFCLWMLRHNTYQVGALKADFDSLLKDLGFLNERLDPEVLNVLRKKVRGRFASLKDLLVKASAVKEIKDEAGKPELIFALWTETWEKNDWDGDYTGPHSAIQSVFESNFT